MNKKEELRKACREAVKNYLSIRHDIQSKIELNEVTDYIMWRIDEEDYLSDSAQCWADDVNYWDDEQFKEDRGGLTYEDAEKE